ncbi:tetratricopeptide repeat-containing sensor histidine kinase [Chitinophaga agri]|uniref:histidine kinase n=1 Tax=Chitinophaga agri TaxID=2703787 RepID=A0A6B9ZJ66_9BACT|nr:tetratricopeptide repeat protein [Chitinophaga agri]QHS61125.1 tetratricopeptide repeat protein [Chitinophaga agri]
MNRLLLVLLYILLGILPCMARQNYRVAVPVLQRMLAECTTDTGRVRVSLELAEAYVIRPGMTDTDYDSTMMYLQHAASFNIRAKDARWEARADFIRSKAYREKGWAKEGRDAILKALPRLEVLNYPEDLADALMEAANYYSIDKENQLQEKISLYEKAVTQYHKAGNMPDEAYALKMLGDCYHCWGKYDEALLRLNQTLVLYKKMGRKDLQGLYDLLGTIATGKGDYSLGLTYGLQALKTAEAQKDTSLQLCTICNRLSITLFELGDYKKAQELAEKSLRIAKQYQDTMSMIVVTTNLVPIYQKNNDPQKALDLMTQMVEMYKQPLDKDQVWIYTNMVKCYVELRQLDKAASYIPGLLTLSSQMTRYNYYQTLIYATLVKYYYTIRQFDKVTYYCMLEADACKRIGHINALSLSYLYWFRADSALGNLSSAIQHYKEYKVVNDSLFKISKAGEIARLQVQYDFDQKNKDITLKQQNIELLTRQGLLQRAALKEAQLTRNIIITGAVMLLLLLILSYNRYQLKQESNKRLQLSQEEISKKNLSLQQLIDTQDKLLEEKEWLVKEIHHRVRNNLQIVMSLLNTQAAYLHDSNALEAISESRYRMQAISLIHQKLYLSGNMALIDMQNYIRELTSYLRSDFGGLQHIYFDLDIAAIRLDVSQAVPASLILNEALTNAIKYAFSKQEAGIIQVSFKCAGDGMLTLHVHDNGEGFPHGFDIKTHGTMGMRLIETLTEQLEGTLVIEASQGVSVQVSFKQQMS